MYFWFCFGSEGWDFFFSFLQNIAYINCVSLKLQCPRWGCWVNQSRALCPKPVGLLFPLNDWVVWSHELGRYECQIVTLQIWIVLMLLPEASVQLWVLSASLIWAWYFPKSNFFASCLQHLCKGSARCKLHEHKFAPRRGCSPAVCWVWLRWS